jgi:processive 1,2-diacylglycerol beta-glucosyltransferase
VVRPPRPHVLVLSASIGQGHDGAARELVRRLDRRGVTADVLDWTDLLPAWGRRALRDLYAPTVHRAPALFDRLFTDLEHPRRPASLVAQRLITVAERPVLDVARGADAVVTTYPLAGRTLGALRAGGRLGVPALTFLTDPAAHRLWCHPGLDEHLTVTDAAAADGARYGVALRSVGPLCAPRFSRPMPVATRARVRHDLGIPDDAPTALLVTGSLGMGDVEATVDALGRHPRAWAIVACGRNVRLRERLAGRGRVVTLGWRDDVPELMAAADLLVHNAGGLSCTEAMVAGLPAVTYRPIPGHGRANAAVLDEAGLAPWLREPDELVAAVDHHGSSRPARRRPPRPWWTGGRDASAVAARHAGALETELAAAG